ncbi:DUF6262 family protein [Synechocystis sp. PCC 7509]|uniref:DUF6262 family protein n=1 Tax=Synechocystis sp. PCC 7509 TaxID=927677 RepID=UPI0002ACBE05|nr:DUF6262 family protein [Synechocystis sp. PCC 7509]
MVKEDVKLGWERNTKGIKAAAQKKRQEAFAKTEEAIKKLLRLRQPINFEAVAVAANVTRAWLYRQPELRSRIEALREQQAPKKQLPEELRASDASKTTLITELRKQSKELRAENQKLKRELEDAYGQALGLEELRATNRNLEKQNQHLLNLLTQARAEAEALKEQKIR